MNHHLHDAQVHNKRTSINELLNPVGPGTSLPPSYNQQLPSLSTALQYQPSHQHAQPPAQFPQQHPSQVNNGPQFSLRAANWASQQKEELAARRSEAGDSSCHYPPSSSMPPQTHPMYADSYARRPVDEAPPHYSMGVAQSWPSSHETYAPPMISPAYPDRRTGELLSVHDVLVHRSNLVHSLAASGEEMPRSESAPSHIWYSVPIIHSHYARLRTTTTRSLTSSI